MLALTEHLSSTQFCLTKRSTMWPTHFAIAWFTHVTRVKEDTAIYLDIVEGIYTCNYDPTRIILSAFRLRLLRYRNRLRCPSIPVCCAMACTLLLDEVNPSELLYTSVIYLWLHVYMMCCLIQCFVVAQQCLRIQAVRESMSYSNDYVTKDVFHCYYVYYI